MRKIIKRLKYFRLLAAFLLIICSCSTDDQRRSAKENKIFEQILPQVFDSLAAEHTIETKKILYYKDIQDKLKKTILQVTIDSLSEDSSLQASLIRSLNDIVHKPVILDLEERSLDAYHIICEQREVEKLIVSDSESFCVLNLSPITFDETGTIGCFYLALSCSKDAGRGYFIYIYKEVQWQTLAILQTWHT